MVADPEINVVDIAAPTRLHAPVAIAAARAGKHVIVDKPLALTSAEARQMLAAAEDAGVAHALTFNIRYNVMVQHARACIARGDIGEVRFVHGHYLQEWLLEETDFNWRIEPEEGGGLAMVADAGAHWYDMVQHLTGRRIVRVFADLATFIPVRRKPSGSREAFASAAKEVTSDYKVEVPDLGALICQFDNGARGVFATSALCAGHKNDLTVEVNGSRASIRWLQERPSELWIGHRDQPNQILLKDPPLLDPSVRQYAYLPGGHNEAWAGAFRNLMHNILSFMAEGRPMREANEDEFPSFEAGLRVACIIDAIAESARTGTWADVKQD